MSTIRSAPVVGVLTATLIVLGLLSTLTSARRHTNEFADVYAPPRLLEGLGGR